MCPLTWSMTSSKLATYNMWTKFRYPVVSYPWTFHTQTICTQGQLFGTHFQSVSTQPTGRFVPNKLSKSFQSFLVGNLLKHSARMRKVYVWSYLLYFLTLYKSYRPEARRYVIYSLVRCLRAKPEDNAQEK